MRLAEKIELSGFLKKVLLLNMAFTGICGILAIALPEPIGTLFGIAPSWIIIFTGVLLLFYAGQLLWVASISRIWLLILVYFAVMDFLWVLGAVGLVVAGVLPASGQGFLWNIGISTMVFFFAILEVVGIRKLKNGN